MRKAPLFPVLAVLAAAVVLTIYYLYSQPFAFGQDQSAEDEAATTPLDQPTVDYANPAIGPVNAKVTIVEFGDYICSPCATLDSDLIKLTNEYPDEVRLVWKDLPNELSHPGSSLAAIAGRCAGLQDEFWRYHKLLMAGQAGGDQAAYVQAAVLIGLDEQSFHDCLQEEQSKPLVQRDLTEGLRLRIDATPYLFVNDRRFSGAISYDLLKNIVEGEINQADAAAASGGTDSE